MSYAGEAHHTACWPHHPVDFDNKRVGVIGTGASAIQTLPEIVDKSASLTAFQRPPNSNGLRLTDAWAEGPRTFLGLQPEGSPNMFMLMGPHTARGNIRRSIEQSVEWLAGLVRFMRDNGYTRIEPRPEPAAAWTQHVVEVAQVLLSYNVDSWITGVNQNVEGQTVRRVVGYNGSAARYRKRADAVAAGGYREFIMD